MDTSQFIEIAEQARLLIVAAFATAIELANKHGPQVAQWLTQPLARILGLAAIVWLTIWFIAWIYTGNLSNSEYGPVGIRPHVAKRLGRKDIVVPKKLIDANVDGVVATCEVYYAYNDRKGARRRVKVGTLKDAKLHLSPVKLTPHSATIYGLEIPDVATEDVCFPPFELTEAPAEIEPTLDKAADYADRYKIIENWKEDDEALLVSVSSETLAELADARREFIKNAAARAKRARERPQLARIIGKTLALRAGDKKGGYQPNVVGNYTLRFRFSRNPGFILSRHPDRDLKMTAWLTVLTSLFAVVMDYWDKAPTSTGSADSTVRESTRPHSPARRP